MGGGSEREKEKERKRERERERLTLKDGTEAVNKFIRRITPQFTTGVSRLAVSAIIETTVANGNNLNQGVSAHFG